jgi:hypothetical protein
MEIFLIIRLSDEKISQKGTLYTSRPPNPSDTYPKHSAKHKIQ